MVLSAWLLRSQYVPFVSWGRVFGPEALDQFRGREGHGRSGRWNHGAPLERRIAPLDLAWRQKTADDWTPWEELSILNARKQRSDSRITPSHQRSGERRDDDR
jgi:hypothetical protein